MADMIDAKEAKSLLGCDDAALNAHINGGAIRAQRVGGKLMLNKDDVMKLKDDDGTIVLTGDSDELNIDLGKVVDDASETIVQPRKDHSGSATESITFGDELEVVSFDDGNTKDLNFEKTKATSSGLSFTDSNTAIGTDPEGTAVGTATATATATSDFQTVDYGEEAGAASGAGGTMRRSVRSQRVRYEKPKTHWIWPTVLILNLLIAALWVVPYFFMMLWPQDQAYYSATLEVTKSVKGYDRYYITGEQRRGVIDGGIWTSMAEGVAGFSVEPDQNVHNTRTNGESEWRSINADGLDVTPDVWRYQQYRQGAKPEDRPEFWIIDSINRADDGNVETAGAMKKAATAESKDANGGTLKSFPVAPKAIDGLGEGTRIDLPTWSHK